MRILQPVTGCATNEHASTLYTLANCQKQANIRYFDKNCAY